MTALTSSPRVLVLVNDAVAPVGRLDGWLRDAGADVVLLDAAHEPVPRQVPDGVSALIALGGTMSATSDDVAPWLPAERALLSDAVSREVPVLGVCLGAQLLGVALGGEVSRARPGEAGITELELTPAAGSDPILGGLTPGAPVAQYHGDEVVGLPAGATVLAVTPGCATQVWRAGPAAWAVQGHPEADDQIFTRWASDDPRHARRCGIEPEAAIDDVLTRLAEVEKAWLPVVSAFVRLAAEASPG
ncbi:MAG TPA: type 1 glutamine amidotransferase [Candidatus Nanopelagicales bacterium]|nr:type 1 glutamine amidotransferase [Candidatus Nanopelagicales bacterium]